MNPEKIQLKIETLHYHFRAVYALSSYIDSTPNGLVLGTIIAYVFSLSKHPNLNWQESNLFSPGLVTFPLLLLSFLRLAY